MKPPTEPTKIIYPSAIDTVFVVIFEAIRTNYGKAPVELARSPVRKDDYSVKGEPEVRSVARDATHENTVRTPPIETALQKIAVERQ